MFTRTLIATRVLVAKVALRVATEDEVFWVNKCIAEGCDCAKDVDNLRSLASAPTTASCLDEHELIQVADENKMSDATQDHLVSCTRCALIGQYIANMASNVESSMRKSFAS